MEQKWGKVIDGTGPFINMGHCKICDKLSPLNNDGICEACVKKYDIKSKNDKSNPILADEETFLKKQKDDSADIISESHIKTGQVKNESYNNREKEQSNLQPTDKVFPKGTLGRKFYSFYKFFHHFSIIASTIMWVGWLIYFATGSSQNSTDQYNATQYYLQTGKSLQVAPFNAHWSVPIITLFILILGLFLSYVSAALCKWVEKIEK